MTVRATRNDILGVTLERIAYRDGGTRPIRRLSIEQWRDIPYQDPPQFAAAVLNLFMDQNGAGTAIVCELMYLWYQADEGRALKYYQMPQYGKGHPHFQSMATQGSVNQILRAKIPVPGYMVVALADTLGIPEDEFVKRASAGADEHLLHVSRRKAEEPVAHVPEERIAAIRVVFGDIPLRRPLADVEMLALAERFAAALTTG